MTYHLKDAPQRSYSEVDQDTWRRLCARQLALVDGHLPALYQEGLARLELPLDRLPVQEMMSERLHQLTGWRLSNAQDEYLGHLDWFIHLSQQHFPVTDYIRKPEHLEFTPLPDLFHEYFGHLAWMTLPRYNEVVNRFTRHFLAADTKAERDAIADLWWFSIEFGLVREGGEVKPFGAGILSSPGEFQHAMQSPELHRPFSQEGASAAQARPYAFHEQYFVLDGFEQLEAMTANW